MRIYQAIFYYVYGTLIVLAIGDKYADIVGIITLTLALICAVVSYIYLYRAYKRHFIFG
jgi:hypothetical protein